ncbi:MAG: ABC transporter ATP-binding protein [bacterium]
MTENDVVIHVRGLGCTLPGAEHPLFSDVEAVFRRGQLSLVKGRTGVGKSTFLMCLSGIIPRYRPACIEGAIEYSEALTDSVPLPIVFDNPESQILSLTVHDELRLSLEKETEVETSPAVRECMELVRFRAGDLRACPYELSDGQKQKLVIMCLLLRETGILLFDDPISMQDYATRMEFGKILTNLRKAGKTVIVASHDLDLYFPNFDHVYSIGDRRLVELGRRSQCSLPSGPSHPSRQKLDTPAAHDTAPIAVLDSVSFDYPNGTRAVDNVSFELCEGETVGVVGCNGSGKSTLALLMNGALKPTKGTVTINGMDTRRHHAAQLARHVAIVFQNPRHSILKETVLQDVCFGAENLGVAHATNAARELLAALDLEGLEALDPVQLSLGQQKLCCIAGALLMRTPVMILDEPDMGVDRETMAVLLRTQLGDSRSRRTLVLVSHHLDLLYDCCDRVLVLHRGALLASGPARRVLADQALLTEAELALPLCISGSRG